MPQLRLNLQHRKGQTLLEPTGGNVVVLVDGQEVESAWGASGIELDRGENAISVHVRWFFGATFGNAQA
jgi:hypothetical protein